MELSTSPEDRPTQGRPARLLESIAFVAIFLIAMIAIDGLLHLGGARMTRMAAVSILVKIGAFILVSIAIQNRLKGKITEMVSLSPASIGTYALVALGTMGVQLLLGPIDGFLSRTWTFFYHGIRLERMDFVPNDMVGTVLRSLLVSPTIEETLFRGIVFAGLMRNYRLPTALLASSLMFAFYHLNPAQFLGPLLSGIVFASAYRRSGSLWPCLLGHVLNNAIWFFYMVYHPELGPGTTFAALRVGVGIVLVVASVALMLFPRHMNTRGGSTSEEVADNPSAI